MKEKQAVYSWSDGSWYFDHEISEPTSCGKSDDYKILIIPTFVTEDDIDTILNWKNNELIIGLLNLIDDVGTWDVFSIRKINHHINELKKEGKLTGSFVHQLNTVVDFIFPNF